LPSNEKSNRLTALALGLDENLVCMTNSQQLFHCSLQNSNISKDHPNTFDYLISPFHSVGKLGFAAITGMKSQALHFSIFKWHTLDMF
jgi:hypothetical protein